MNYLPKGEERLLKKRNRILKSVQKKHKIAHESGRSTKNLWMRIVERSKQKKN